MQRDNK